MAARWSTVVVLALCSGCSGGGGGGGEAGAPVNPPAPVPPAQQSAGGMWFAVPSGSNATTLMIAETGEFRVITAPAGANGPGFGHGAVTVIGNRVEGSFETRVLGPPTAPVGAELDCTVSGTVSTRASMQLTTVCVDGAGASTTTSLSFMYDAHYDADSSLAEIAGNYTLAVNTATNTLNINGDGTLFGMYHNGPRCTLNGTVSIIHSDFNLYRFGVLFSSCTVLASRYEGVTMTGFATRNPPGQKAGAFLLLLTAVIDGRLEFASVMYEPV
jgi:uncharacterized Zn-binding protein involved in type VI secretion